MSAACTREREVGDRRDAWFARRGRRPLGRSCRPREARRRAGPVPRRVEPTSPAARPTRAECLPRWVRGLGVPAVVRRSAQTEGAAASTRATPNASRFALNQDVHPLARSIAIALVTIVAACVEPRKDARAPRDAEAERAHVDEPRADNVIGFSSSSVDETAVVVHDADAASHTPSITIEFVDARGVPCTLADVELTATLGLRAPLEMPLVSRVRLASAQSYVLAPAEPREWTFTARTSGAVPVLAELRRDDPSSQQRSRCAFRSTSVCASCRSTSADAAPTCSAATTARRATSPSPCLACELESLTRSRASR